MDTLTLTFLCSQKNFSQSFESLHDSPQAMMITGTWRALFWSTGVRSGGQTCSHVLAWHSASAKTIALYCLGADWPQKAWHSLFPELSKIQKKLRPRVCSKTHMRLTQIIRDFESPSNWISNRKKKLEQTKSCCSKILHLLRSLNVHTATGLTCEKTMKAAEGSREGHQAITQQRNHQATCYFTAK